MADITITAANVAASAAVKTRRGSAGAAITAGDVLYLDTATNTLKLAIATALATAVVAGIALNDAASGQPVVYAYDDSALTVGGTLVTGTVYTVSSAVAGAIAPVADQGSADFVTVLGVANSTALLALSTDSKLQGAVAIT